MAQTNLASMTTAKEHIDILLKEYDTLRTEALTRMNHRWQMVGLIGVILALVLPKGEYSWLAVSLVFFCFIGLIVLWVITARYIRRIGVHISGIESRINQLADARLLTWETEAQNRLIRRFF